MCKEVDGAESSVPFKTPVGLPDPGTGLATQENAIAPTRHVTRLSVMPNPLEGKDVFQEIDLSPMSDNVL